MKKLLLLLFAASVSTPALAQHSGHAGPPPPPPAERADPHAGHTAPPPPAQPPTDPHAGHSMTPQQPGQPAGQTGSAQPGVDPHAGHQMSPEATEIPAPPVGPPPPEALSGPAHAADSVFGRDQMAEARRAEREEHGATRNYRFLVDQLEIGFRDGAESYTWEDAQFWYGGDIDRLWIKSQGEGTFGEGVESAEVQALWSHAIDPWFDLQAGVRYDFRPDPERAYLVLGIQGLAPYWFEIDSALFLSSKGDLSARFEVEYDLRITQRLILQPRVEADFQLQDVPELGLGSGLSTAEPGLRLRYEIVPEFAPFIGVQYERAFGDTARFRRIAGEGVGGWSLVLGVRAWF